MENKFYSMKELAEVIPIGTNNLYKLVHSEGFPSIIINRRILIPIEPLNEWIKASASKEFKL